MGVTFEKEAVEKICDTVLLTTVDSRYYVDRLLRYIGYYVGNSKHQTIFYINLYKLFPLLRCPKMQNPGITM